MKTLVKTPVGNPSGHTSSGVAFNGAPGQVS